MIKDEVLKILSDGHTIISVWKAEEVCKFCQVPFSKILVKKWKSDPLGTFKGLTMLPEFEGKEGVYTLTLSSYIAEMLGVGKKAGTFYGRGSQARAYAKEIGKVLK